MTHLQIKLQRNALKERCNNFQIFFCAIYEGRYESNTSFFLSKPIIIIIINITCIMRRTASFTKLRLFSRNVSFVVNTLFKPSLETAHCGCLNSVMKRRGCSVRFVSAYRSPQNRCPHGPYFTETKNGIRSGKSGMYL